MDAHDGMDNMRGPTDWEDIRRVGRADMGPHRGTFEQTDDYDPFDDEDDLNYYHRELLKDTSADVPFDTAGEAGASEAMRGARSYYALSRQYGVEGGDPYAQNHGELLIQETYNPGKTDIHVRSGQHARSTTDAMRRRFTQDSADGAVGETPSGPEDYRKRRDANIPTMRRMLQDEIGSRENLKASGTVRRLLPAATYQAPLTAGIGTNFSVGEAENVVHAGMRGARGGGGGGVADADFAAATAAGQRAGAAAALRNHRTAVWYQAESADWGDERARRNYAMAGTLRRARAAVASGLDIPADELGEAMLAVARGGLHPATAGAASRSAHKGVSTQDFGADGDASTHGDGAGQMRLAYAQRRGSAVGQTGVFDADFGDPRLENAAEMAVRARRADFRKPHEQRARTDGMSQHGGRAASGLGGAHAEDTALAATGHLRPSVAAFAASQRASARNERLFRRDDAVVNYATAAPAPRASAYAMQDDEGNLSRLAYIVESAPGTGLHPATAGGTAGARHAARETQRPLQHVNAAGRAGRGQRAATAADVGAGRALALRAGRDADGGFGAREVNSDWVAAR